MATAQTNAIPTASRGPSPVWKKATQKVMMATIITKMAMTMETRSICSRTAVFWVSTLFTSALIVPIWVWSPVSTTTPTPRPCETKVAEKAIFLRSPRGTSAGFWASMASVILSIGRLSPVSEASVHARLETSIIRISAGIRSPSLTTTMSPGTIFSAGTLVALPSRSTSASLESIALRASAAFSADPSCMIPIQALSVMTKMMSATSSQLVMASSVVLAVKALAALTMATTTRMPTRTLLTCSQMRRMRDLRSFSLILLGPYSSRRFSASAEERPFLVVSRRSMVA
mmetsp:Transcript_27419/g.49589  ORF Transcript_27419/g.49589 Transcript_27419/m.49589 type:complete len:287 (-) Transcript_27419:210-1070(-)